MRSILALGLLRSYYSFHALRIELKNLSVPSIIYITHRTVHLFVLMKSVILGLLIFETKINMIVCK